MSSLAAVLGIVAIALVAAAIWVAARTAPKLDVGWLPIGVGSVSPPRAFPPRVAAAAAAFVSLAALQAAAAMRVLARDRRIPPRCLRACARCAAWS